MVITGHIILGEITENLGSYIIYSFHMPIFIGISGYLLNYNKIGQLNFSKLFSKYFYRAILPWLIAVVFYLFASKYNQLHLKNIIPSFLNSLWLPFYHLWFIEAFLSWIFIAWAANKLKISITALLIISFVVALFASVMQHYPQLYQHIRYVNTIGDMLMYDFRPFYFMFFVFGIYLKVNPPKMNAVLNIGLVAIFSVGTIMLFYFPNSMASIGLFFLLNLSLLNLLIGLANKDALPHSKPVEWAGVNSLGIYLWHLIPILLLRKIIKPQHAFLFYGVTVITELALLVLINGASKIDFLNVYFLGGQPKGKAGATNKVKATEA